MLYIDDSISVPLREFNFTYVRSSGPGGQNVNKVSTKAVLAWKVVATSNLPPAVKQRFLKKFASRISQEGKLIITSQRFRDRGRNVADCLAKLRAMVLAVRHPPKARRKTKPSRASKERRLDSKRQRAQKKQGRKPVRRDD